MAQAADTQQSCSRFLVAVGFSDCVPVCAQLGLTLLELTNLSIPDIEVRIGLSPRKAAVALYDECLKLRRCLHRSSDAVDVPQWLPVVLSVPHSALEALPLKPRPPSGRRRAHSPTSPVDPAIPKKPSRFRRPLTASERTRFMMSGLAPPMPSMTERIAHREMRIHTQQQLAAHQKQHRELLERQKRDSAEHADTASIGLGVTLLAAHDASAAILPVGGPTIPKHPRRLPDHAAAAAAEAAKAVVLELAGEREAAVGAMRALLPKPKSVVGRRRATRELLFDADALAEIRADLSILLGEMRRTGAAICRAIFEWKLTLRSRSAALHNPDP